MQQTGAPNSKRYSQGFTLLELLVSMVLIAILGTISFTSYQRRVEREQLSSAARDLSDWLDEVRAEAIKAMSSCSLQINNTNPLQTKAEILSSSSACQTQRIFTVGGGGNIQVLSVTPSNGTLMFSPRGTVTNDLELIMSHSRAGDRCLRVSQPLGLIRLGRTQLGQCRYDRPY